ncbi:Eco57I restriction-modification methylase domain-containing protein [Phocaeicola plebeius]|uniref:site-specific DNA-methyltransferase (adenine-specific) n=1 Tax=Phocaeicola plebeius TaxID=310297 RepID=A0A921HK11_9BACT|nr:TaqI-like C-terminal specificity domain-containing protein [Phocaeicola plebeius]HJF80968.1 Eco57I restriction-modification methylase domain-containing protein [Phocaeicola plebeius]
MEFNKAYSRREFVRFLQNSFLPEDFVPSEEEVWFNTKMIYSTEAVKLGTCQSLELVVYEVKHQSKHDARVSLSKEAFRMLADEMKDRALVVFVPEDSNENYRFSLIEITLDAADDSARITKRYSNPRRYSYFLGEGIAYYTPNKYLNEKGRVVSKEDLLSRFSVEVLTKEFYQELSDWYAWAIKIIRFPNNIDDKDDDAKFNNEGAIRLITRLIFVWFLKQRHLIPEEFFDERYIADNLIEGFNPHAMVDLFSKSNESKYYKAILQNLFFAMLNSPITPEGGKELSERHFRNGRGDYDNNKLMRYESYFKNPQLFVDLANRTVPFLNGGLFDCLDDKDHGMYYDGFSDRESVKNSLIIPDYLFFGEEVGKNIDLSEWYGDKKKKKVSARGIIDILKRYNFTVEENTPFDKEVSLDPELLGKVFENLLASFNPETQTTARKQTGSFYTPREIVQYMVDESLVAHLKRTVGEELEPQYRQLMQYSDDDVELTAEQRKSIMQSLYNCKILDPACGSGAFPMGILQQMVHILNRIDPDNSGWKEMMLQKALDETSEAYRNSSSDERKELITDIERSFDESINRPDYARKLYLIENCIYGVDIQPIAIQISKLRFFISLVVDQNTNADPTDNFGIRPLPNLEAKFVAANTLIGLVKKDASLFDSAEIKAKENELKIAKHKIFGAKTVKTKRKYKNIVNDLRQKIADMLYANGAVGNDEARQLASWDMFDQNASSPFFDPEWMFGVKDGFDIVIGNPPYVLISLSLYKKLYRNYYNWQGGKIDLYRLFIECSVKYLTNNLGIIVLITPNTFLTIPSCKLLRKKLIELTHFLFIDNYNLTVFDTASVNNVVFGLTKLYIEDKCRIVIHEDNHQSISYIDQANFYKNLGSEIYINIQKDDAQIINKIKNSSSTTLCQCNIQMCLGEQPYHNTIHTPEEIKAKFLHSKIQVNSNYMLEYGGKNIIRFGIKERQDNWLDYSGELYTKPEFKFFHNPRIILREIVGNQLVATYTEDIFLVNKSCYIIISNSDDTRFLKYLLGILSSTLIGYYVQNIGDKSKQRLFPRITMSTLKNIPIKIDKHVMEKLINVVDACLQIKRQNLGEDILLKEIEIDSLVYHLYGLTYDEVLIVDPQIPITREEYETQS